jgi:two-component system sensor histidine kinase YesM
MAVFSETGELMMRTPLAILKDNVNISQQSWFKDALTKPGSYFFSSPHIQNLFENQSNWVVSLSRPIYFKKEGKLVQGVLLVDMNFNAIEQLCKKVSLGKNGYIYIVDGSSGNIVYHPEMQRIITGLIKENNAEEFEGEKRLISVKTVVYTGWKIVGVSYKADIVSGMQEIGSFVGWIMVLVILLVIFISMGISAKISRPIRELEMSMKLVEEGYLDITIDEKGEYEVVQLSKTFNVMIARIRQLMGQIVLEQEEKRKSELNALQAQINPHFLYNTLDSIVWMAENGKSQDVITMVTSLARLFRISISKGKNIISVQEELEHAKNYLIIQKIRYKNKFEFEMTAQPEVLQYRTLKLILQPIIENAIYHGIEYMVDEGHIQISAEISDDKLLYTIRDNGLGMNMETQTKIFGHVISGKGSSGVGVKNVHERIQLCFGKEYGLEIKSELEEGTTIKLWLPLVVEGGQENG